MISRIKIFKQQYRKKEKKIYIYISTSVCASAQTNIDTYITQYIDTRYFKITKQYKNIKCFSAKFEIIYKIDICTCNANFLATAFENVM